MTSPRGFFQIEKKENLKGSRKGNYLFTDFIAKGIGGAAYIAETKDRKEVVIKVIEKEKKSSYLNELRILQSLEKECEKYLLCYISTFEDEENYYLVTEYLRGYRPLGDFLLESELDSDDRQRIITNLIKGLEHLHSLNISHGDITLFNIMIDPVTLKIKYIDFGQSSFEKRKGDYQELHDIIDMILQKDKIPLILLEDGRLLRVNMQSMREGIPGTYID